MQWRIKDVLGPGRCVKMATFLLFYFNKEQNETFTDYSQRTIGYKALEITTISCSLVAAPSGGIVYVHRCLLIWYIKNTYNYYYSRHQKILILNV